MTTPVQLAFSCPRCEENAHVFLPTVEADPVEANPVEANPVGPEAAPALKLEQTWLECPNCQLRIEYGEDAVEEGKLQHCLVCPSTDLFVRKDFPQRLGVGLVVVGFAASCLTWYFHMLYLTFAILFLTALIDVVLYLVVGNALVCYRCGAHYRHVPGVDRYDAFNLETHERHRQQVARIAQAERSAAYTQSARAASGESTAASGEVEHASKPGS